MTMLALLSFSVAVAQCDYTLELTDGFGDGWAGGATITVTVGAGTPQVFSIPVDATNMSFSQTETITVNTGDNIVLDYNQNGTLSPGENSFILRDSEGIIVFDAGFSPATAVNNFTAACPTCPAVSAINAPTIGGDNVDIAWTAGGAETEWIIEYGVSPYTCGSGGTQITTTTNPTNVPGLSPLTTYDFYVIAVCSTTDQSACQGPVQVTTSSLCPEPFNFAPIDNLPREIQFGWDTNGNAGGTVTIEYAPDGVITTPGTGQGTTLTGQLSGFAFISGLTPETCYDFYVQNDCANGFSSIWSAEYEACTTISCPAPTSVTASAISFDSMNIDWTAGMSETEWELEYAPAGTITTPFDTTPQGTVLNVMTTPSQPLSGLTDATTYDVYVRAVCDRSISDFSAAVQITPTTLCLPLPAPYTESFDTAALPNCWSSSADDGAWAYGGATNTTQCSAAASDFNANGGSYAWVDFSGTDNNVLLSSPLIDVSSLTVPYLSFQQWMCTTGYSPANELYVEANDGTGNFVQVALINTGDAAWTEFGFSLAPYVSANNTVQFRFRAESGGSTSDFVGDLALDNIVLDEAPSCINPTNLGVTNVTAFSADLVWQENNVPPGTDWTVEYAEVGVITTPGTAQGTEVLMASNPLPITSLTAATGYEFYVKTICAVGDESEYVGPFTFATQCDVFAVPFLETFDAGSSTQQCWTVIDENADGDAWDLDYAFNPFGGAGEVAAITTDFNAGNNDDYLVSPAITLTGNERLVYQYRVQSANEPDDFEVLLSTTTPDAAGFTNVILPQATYSNVAYQEQIIDISAFTGDVYIAWRIPPNGPDGWRMYIDEVVVEAIPSCPRPVNFVVNSNDDVSIDMTWDAGGSETEWIVEYATPDFATGTLQQELAVTNNVNYILGGLTPNTPYEVRIVAACAPGDLSTPTATTAVRTSPQGPQGVTCPNNDAAFAWEESFDNGFNGWTGDVGTGSGQWDFTGGNAANGGTGSTGTGPFAPAQGTNYVFFETSGTNVGPRSMVSPAIDLTNATDEAELSFFFHSIGGDLTTFEVGVGTDPAGPFTNVFTFVGPLQLDQNDAYALVGASLPASVLGSATVHIQITGTEEAGNETGFVGDVAIDLMRIETCGNFCSNPDMLDVTNITTTTADLTFNDTSGTPTGNYEYVLQPVGTGVPTGAGTATTLTTVPLGPLTTATFYEVYVRNVCGGTAGFSDWVGPLEFATECDIFTVPFYESFDPGSGSQQCWTVLNENADFDEWNLDYAFNPFGGSGEVAAITTDFNGGANDDYLITPQITLTGNERLVYQYRVQSAAEPDDFEVLLSTTTPDAAGLTNVILPQATYSNVTYVEEVIDLSAFTGNVYIAWRVPPGGPDGWRLYIDDVLVETIPACPNISDISADQITSTGANLSWTENDVATAWEFEYDLAGFAQGSGANGIVSTNDNSVNAVSGLTPDTNYDVYARSVCPGGTTFSNWVGPFTFSTRCAPLTAPYFTDYESDPLNGLNNCDSNIVIGSGTGTAPEVRVDDLIANSGNQHIYMYSGSTGATAELYYVMPEFSDLDAAKRVRFFAYDRDLGGLEVGTMTDPADPATFSVAQAFTNADLPDDQYVEQTVNFTSLTTTGGWIAFRFLPAGTFDAMYLDDINYEDIPSCPQPTSVSTANLTDTSVELTWQAGGSETEWTVEYGTPGFTPGGTGSLGVRNGVTVNTNFVLDMLSANTEYEIRVFAVCAPTDISPSANPVTIRTFPTGPQGANCATGSPAVVFTESFENGGAGWTGTTFTGNGGDWDISGGNANSTGTGPFSSFDGANHMEYEATGGNSATASAITPAIDLSTGMGEAELSFYMHAFGNEIGDLTVGVSTSATGPFTPEFTWTGGLQSSDTDAWAPIGVDLTAYNGQIIFIEFSYTMGPVGFEGDLSIDLIEVAACGSFCPDVSQLDATAITSTGANLSWTENGSATEWEYEVDVTGFTQGSGANGIVSTMDNTTNAVSGLLPATSYDYYVRAVCGATQTSAWVGPLTFTTECAVFVAPFNEPFDNTSIPNCWSSSATTGGPWLFSGATNSATTGCSGVPSFDFNGTGGSHAWMDFSGTDVGVVLEMPEIDVTALTDPFLQFQQWMCTTGQTVFNELYVEAIDPATGNYVQIALINTGTAAWTEYGYSLTPYVSGTGTVQIRFRAESGNDTNDFLGDIALDDVSVIEEPAASVDSSDVLGFSYYPNPTQDVVTFNGNETIDSITVNNMLGQEVIKLTPGTEQAQIDLATFTTGVYLVTVQTGDRSSTVKIVKE